jgi:hypothetical protein
MDGHAGSNKENKDKKLSHKPIIAKMPFFGNMSRESASLSPGGLRLVEERARVRGL